MGMPTAKLTKSLVEQLPQNEILWDTAIVGLGARRQTKGTFYVVRARVDGRQKMKSLGRHGHLTVEQARKLAQAHLGQLAQGDNPFATVASETFADLVPRFLVRQCSRLRPRSFVEVERHLRQLGQLAHRPVADITRRDIAAHLASVEAASGGYSRNRLRSTFSTFFSWLIREGLIETSPVQGTDKAPEVSRDRVLTDAEIAAIWHALPSGDYGAVIKLLLLTGQRLSEIAGLLWTEIDFDASVIRLPASRTKNKTAHEVPLSPAAKAILAARPKTGEKVFKTLGWTERKATLDRRLGPGFQPWRQHDCRRTVATGMANLGVAPHVVEACLNHQTGSRIALIYNRAKYEPEKRAALELWATHLSTIVGLAKAAAAA
jgi:integrase